MASFWVCEKCEGEIPYSARLTKRDCKGKRHWTGKCLSVDKRCYLRPRREPIDREYAMQAGMAGGCEAYNEAMGWEVE